MTQSNALSDALAKSSSMLSGLLSQMGAFGQNSGKGDLFAELLANDSTAKTGFDLKSQTVASKTNVSSTFGAPSMQDAADASGATDDVSSDTSSISTVMQNLRSLAHTLQKIMHGLQHAKNNALKQQQSPGDGDTQDEHSQAQAVQTTTDATAAAPSTASTVAATNTAQDATPAQDDSSDPAKMVSDIIAELLAMTQLAMQALKQAAVTGNSATAPTADAATANNQLLSDLQSAGGLTLGNGLQDLVKDLQILNENARLNVTDAAGAQTTDATTNPLLDLLKTLEKDVLQLWPIPSDTDATGQTQTAAKPEDISTLSNMSAQFAALDKVLKQVVSGLEQQVQSQTTVTRATTQLAQVAKNDAQNAVDALTAALPSMGAANAPDPDTKSVASDAVQNRLYPLTPTSAPQTHAATQAQVQAQQNAQVQPQTTQSSTSVTQINATAIAAAAKETATGGANDDMLSDHQAAFSSSNSETAPTFNAEGAQATGTYSFASTLSAFRAANGGSTGLPSVVDQVILQMNRSVKSGNDQLTLQLHPADLGKITVKLDVGSDGKVQGTVTADNPKTLDMLQKDSRSLERALQDAGLRADPGSLQFNLGSQQDQRQAGQTADGQNGDSTNADGTLNASENTELADANAAAETYYITPGGVNIRV